MKGNEVEVDPRVFVEPRPDGRMLVGGVVVLTWMSSSEATLRSILRRNRRNS